MTGDSRLTGNGNVERHGGDDGGEEQQLQGADDGQLDLVHGRLAADGKRAAQLLVARLVAQAGGLLLQDDWGVRLLQGEVCEDGDDAGQDGDEPVHPAPPSGADQVAAGHGADAGAEQGTEGPGGHGSPAHLDGHHVGDAAAADGDGHGAGDAHEEAEGHHHADAVAQGGADAEDGEEDVADVVEQGAAVDLAHRRDDEGAKGEAQDVDGQDEGGGDRRRLVVLGEDSGDTGGEHGRAKGSGVCQWALSTRTQPRRESALT